MLKVLTAKVRNAMLPLLLLLLPAETVNSRGSSSNRSSNNNSNESKLMMLPQRKLHSLSTVSRVRSPSLSLQVSLRLLLLLLLSWSLQIFNALILMLINLEVAATFALLSLRAKG